MPTSRVLVALVAAIAALWPPGGPRARLPAFTRDVVPGGALADASVADSLRHDHRPGTRRGDQPPTRAEGDARWIGTSIFVMATGAVLAFAIEREVGWIDIETAGSILIVVGGLAFICSLLVAQSVGPWRRRDVVDG